MTSPKLLREYIKLLVEAEAAASASGGVFTVKGPVKRAKYPGEYSIVREFPAVLPPEMLAAMRVGPDELDANGAFDGEHEITLDVDIYYQKSRFKGSRLQPPDPDEFEIGDFEVDTLDGFRLSPEDSAALKQHLGDLTREEKERIEQTFFDLGHDVPEPDIPSDYD